MTNYAVIELTSELRRVRETISKRCMICGAFGHREVNVKALNGWRGDRNAAPSMTVCPHRERCANCGQSFEEHPRTHYDKVCKGEL
jgi:hypothetical protein